MPRTTTAALLSLVLAACSSPPPATCHQWCDPGGCPTVCSSYCAMFDDFDMRATCETQASAFYGCLVAQHACAGTTLAAPPCAGPGGDYADCEQRFCDSGHALPSDGAICGPAGP